MINKDKVETFDTLRRNGMKILDTDPELYFDVSRREDLRYGFVDHSGDKDSQMSTSAIHVRA